MHEGLESGLGLLLRNARLQAAKGIHPAIAALFQHVFRVTDDNLRLHHDGNEDFRRASELYAVKTGLGDADNGHVVIIQIQRLADDLGIAGKTCLPIVVIENNEGMAAWYVIVLGREYASQGGEDAESREVGARHQFHIDAFRLAAKGKTRRGGKAAEHFREHFVVTLKVTEHGMGDRIAAPVAAVVASLHGEQDELLRIFDREQPQQNLVEEGEYCRVRADAQCQSQNGYGRETRRARKHAQGVLQVAKDGVEPADDSHAASGIIADLGHRDTSG